MAEIIEIFPEERRLKMLFSKSMEDLRRAEQRDLERSVRRGMEASAETNRLSISWNGSSGPSKNRVKSEHSPDARHMPRQRRSRSNHRSSSTRDVTEQVKETREKTSRAHSIDSSMKTLLARRKARTKNLKNRDREVQNVDNKEESSKPRVRSNKSKGESNAQRVRANTRIHGRKPRRGRSAPRLKSLHIDSKEHDLLERPSSLQPLKGKVQKESLSETRRPSRMDPNNRPASYRNIRVKRSGLKRQSSRRMPSEKALSLRFLQNSSSRSLMSSRSLSPVRTSKGNSSDSFLQLATSTKTPEKIISHEGRDLISQGKWLSDRHQRQLDILSLVKADMENKDGGEGNVDLESETLRKKNNLLSGTFRKKAKESNRRLVGVASRAA